MHSQNSGAEPPETFCSGFVAIVGRPNVGKSTLMNQILGQKIAITSNKPQTTRNRILGIRTTADSQLLFLDTPGIHKAKDTFNEYMVKEATSSYADVDAVYLLIEGDDSIGGGDEYILRMLEKEGVPIILVVNKIDLIEKERLMPLIAAYAKRFPFTAIVPVSALTGDGVEQLVEETAKLMPEGPCYYPEDMVTDLPEKFIVAEMVREQIFRRLEQEIPYGVAVLVDQFVEDEQRDLVSISATINVIRDSHKGIVIGKKGSMIRDISKYARLEIERLLGTKVFLELFVRVQKNWTDSSRLMSEMGYKQS